MKRRLALAAGLMIVPLLMSGCLVIRNVEATQLDTIGKVRVVVDACFSQTGIAPSTCTASGNSGMPADDPGFIPGATLQQPMIAFRIPDRAGAANSFATTAGEAITFALSTDYTEALQALAPAPSGQKWAGYMATAAVAVNDGANQGFTVSPEFTLLAADDGSPFEGPFEYRAVVGSRMDNAGPDAALDCGTSLFDDNGTDTICIDSPSEAETATNLSLETRDLGVISAQASIDAESGERAEVPFVVEFAGDMDPAPVAAARATTTLPATAVVEEQLTLAPNSSNPLSAFVFVPSSATPGTYDVVLEVTLESGEKRSNTSKLVVRERVLAAGAAALDTTPPAATTQLFPNQTIRTMLDKGLKVNVTMNEPGTVGFVLSKGSRWRDLSVPIKLRFGAPGTKQVVLRLKLGNRSGKTLRNLLAMNALDLFIRATGKDLAGNALMNARRITLKH